MSVKLVSFSFAFAGPLSFICYLFDLFSWASLCLCLWWILCSVPCCWLAWVLWSCLSMIFVCSLPMCAIRASLASECCIAMLCLVLHVWRSISSALSRNPQVTPLFLEITIPVVVPSGLYQPIVMSSSATSAMKCVCVCAHALCEVWLWIAHATRQTKKLAIWNWISSIVFACILASADFLRRPKCTNQCWDRKMNWIHCVIF